MGFGDRQRGGNSQGHTAPPAEAQEERRSMRECHQKEEGSWQPKEDPVGHFRIQDAERRFKHAPLVRGDQKGAEV